MTRTLVCVLLLALLSFASASWVIDTSNAKKPHATNGDYKVEILEIENDPIYDLAAWTEDETKSLVVGNKEPSESILEAKEGAEILTIANKHKLHSSSLNVRFSYKGKTIYGLAEGNLDKDFLKPSFDKHDESISLDTALGLLDSLSFSSTRYTERVKSIKTSMTKSAEQHKARFRERYIKGALQPTEERFAETKTQVGPPIRYYVQVHTGHAFHVPLGGQHSATYVYAVNEETNQVQNWLLEFGNHGRVPYANGMAYKCTHRGAVTIGRDDPQPAVWSCTTPYFPVWCFWGGRHNCNACSTFQINISDNPANPPQPNQGICHRACPARAPNC